MDAVLKALQDNAAAFFAAKWVLIPFLVVCSVSVWKYVQHHYGRRVELLNDRLALYQDRLAELEKRLADALPTTRLENLNALRELIRMELDAEYLDRVRQNEKEIEALQRQNEIAASERADLSDSLRQVREKHDQAITEREQQIAALRAKNHELEALRVQAYNVGNAIAQAAARQADKEVVEYLNKRDEIIHRFVKIGDARQEIESLAADLSASAGFDAQARLDEISVDSGNPHRTRVRVIGHEWYRVLRDSPGWSYVPVGRFESYLHGLHGWALAYARNFTDCMQKGITPDIGGRPGKDSAVYGCIDEHNVSHQFAVVATLREGHPAFMSRYFRGEAHEVEQQVWEWVSEYRIFVDGEPIREAPLPQDIV